MTSCFNNYINRIRSSEHISSFFIPALLAGFMFFTAACEDPPGLNGKELLPGSDFVTIGAGLLPVESYTMYRDSVSSSQPSVSYLGSKYDPYFGTTTCEFVSQLRLGSSVGTDNIIVDSVKLFMQFMNVSGDTASRHYLRMSEIADVIYDSLTYYSSQTVPLTGFTIPDVGLPVLRQDTVNSVKLVIDPDFGTYLVRNTDMLFHSSDTDDFRTYFRGLYFQLISPENPIFLTTSLASSTTYRNYFEIYGKNSTGGTENLRLLIDAVTTNASYNLYRHDHSTAQTEKKIVHINDLTVKDTLTYAQTFNGVYTRLILPTLDSIKASPEMKNISVNKARLKIPIYYDNDLYRRTTLPATLYLQYLTTTGHRHYVPETGTYFYNGSADTTSTLAADDVYNLNIASFVQLYLDDKADTILPKLELSVLPSAIYNLIMRANDSYKPVKFEFTYTKF